MIRGATSGFGMWVWVWVWVCAYVRARVCGGLRRPFLSSWGAGMLCMREGVDPPEGAHGGPKRPF